MLGNCCIFRAVTDSRGSSKCIQIKLDRSKHTYIQHSRGVIGKNAGLVPCLKEKKSPSSVTVYSSGGGGGVETGSVLHSVCSKRLLVVQSAREEGRGTSRYVS